MMKVKRLLSLLLCFVLVVGVLPLNAVKADAVLLDYTIGGTISGVESSTVTTVELLQMTTLNNYVEYKTTTVTGNGSYSFSDVLPDNYKLVVSANGYRKLSYAFRLEADLTKNITMEACAFTTQPEGGTVIGDQKLTVNWALNFTPVKLQAVIRLGTVTRPSYKYYELDPTQNTAELPAQTNPYVLNAYYGTGDSDFVRSKTFQVTKVDPSFTTQPAGGTVVYNQYHIANWATNFDAVKQELVRYSSAGNVVQTTALDAGAFQARLPYMTDGYYYCIRAYYDSTSYIESDKFYVTPDQYFTPNNQHGNEEGDIITGITYVPNGDGTFNANVHVDLNYVDGQMLQYYWASTGYYWYDHNNKLNYGIGTTDTSKLVFTLYNLGKNLEPGKEWKVKVYLADDPYADYEWRDVDFHYVTDTVPELKPEDKVTPAFTTQPVGGEVASGEKLTVTWATNFTPVKSVLMKVVTHPVDGRVTIRETLGTASTAEVGAGYDYYFIRAYTETSYVDSDKFYVTEKKAAEHEGWVEENGKWYFYKDGAKATGWLQDGGKWYYMDSTGAMATGWQKVDGKWYYLNNYMKTGWQQIGGKWYYLGSDGAMKTGWVSVGGKWYYMNSSGIMQTGWVSVGGKWYYLNSSGIMQTGWVSVGGKWYYLNSSGVMQTGWVSVGGKWYYMNSSGVMQTGWLQLGGKWYYLNSSGVMVTGTQVIDGKTYKFNSSGVWIS